MAGIFQANLSLPSTFEVIGYLTSCKLEEVSEIIEELCNRFAAKTKSLEIRTATLYVNMY